MIQNKYPVYIISKGRHDRAFTADYFVKDNIDFKIVVEPQEADLYRQKYGNKVAVLPFSNLGMGSTPARNWCWEDSIKNGHERHWIFDDNIRGMYRLHKGKRIHCNCKWGLYVVEQFTDRYINIGLSGFNYTMFVTDKTKYPYYLNTHLYSALLIKNDMPYKWRLKYNEDTDLNLQVLTNKLCIVAFNAINVHKMRTMTMKGGNSSQLYKDDGRLKMARTLEAMWPKYVKVVYKFGRPQHSVNWKVFTHKLKRKPNLDIQPVADIKLQKLTQIKSKRLQKLYTEVNQQVSSNIMGL
jgi:hypothetical protein